VRQLTTRRFFDWGRSFHLPVFQLEGQSGKAASERFAVLDKRTSTHAVWLTVAFSHFHFVLTMGLVGLVFMLLPQQEQVGLGRVMEWLFGTGPDVADRARWLDAANTLSYGLIVCFMQPFYVAAGFALYLNRRTQLEGWDLELAFKRLAARRLARTRPAVAILAALGLSLVLLGGVSQDAWAQAPAAGEAPVTGAPAGTPSAGTPSAATAVPPVSSPVPTSLAPSIASPSKHKQAIEKVLQDPAFNEHEKTKVWKERNPSKPQQRDPPSNFWRVFADMIDNLAGIVRVLAWVVVIGIAIALLVVLARRLGWVEWGTKRSKPKPGTLFGLDVRPESLPVDIPAAARALLDRGDVRGALSLLYRGALAGLIAREHLQVEPGDTEGDCVRQVEARNLGGMPAYFRALVQAWQQCAYAKAAPTVPDTQQLVGQWAQFFGVAPVPSAQPAAKGAA
jgi:hypothetical protein